MATTPEGKVKAAVTAILKKESVYYFFPATHGYGRSGVPDIVCCVNGKFLAIECKADEKSKITALQSKELFDININGGVAVIIHSGNIDLVYGIIKLLSD